MERSGRDSQTKRKKQRGGDRERLLGFQRDLKKSNLENCIVLSLEDLPIILYCITCLQYRIQRFMFQYVLILYHLDSVLCIKFEMVFFTLDKSRDSELQNGISYTAFEEQWKSYSALKVDQLVNSLLRKWPLNVLVSSEELFLAYTHSASFTAS